MQARAHNARRTAAARTAPPPASPAELLSRSSHRPEVQADIQALIRRGEVRVLPGRDGRVRVRAAGGPPAA